MRRSLKFICALVGIAAMVSQADAARLYFTTSNAIPDGGAPNAGVPEITLAPGEMADLYVWVDLANDGDGGDGPDLFMAGYGLDLVASNAGIVEAVSSELFNPTLLISGVTPFSPRWGGGFGEADLNPDGAGGAALAINARGFSVNPSGAAGIYGTNIGNGPGLFFPVLDPLYDATNGVFLAQHLKIMARDTGPGTHSTGIVMHVGENAFSLDNSAGTEYVYFGDGPERVANGDVGGSNGRPQALITVEGGSTGRTELIVIGGDPTGATEVGFDGRIRPTDIPIGGPAGRLNIDSQWQVDSFFDVFFDIEIAPSSNTDLAGVVAMLEGQGFNVLPGTTLDTQPTPTDYDLRLRIPGNPGENLVMDFDFSANGVEGVSVNSVGVPEPSSFVLAALGCVAALGLRRRRTA